MNCHRCPDYMKHQGEAWETTRCATCHLTMDSYGTLELQEGHISNSSKDADNSDDEVWTRELADGHSPQPYASLDGDAEDPQVPLSALVEAMQLWTRLSLPARKTFQMRMSGLPFSEIGKRLGFSRQMAEKLVAKAIAEDGLLQNLVPSKKFNGSAPLSGTRASAIGEPSKCNKRGRKIAVLSHNTPHTRTA